MLMTFEIASCDRVEHITGPSAGVDRRCVKESREWEG